MRRSSLSFILLASLAFGCGDDANGRSPTRPDASVTRDAATANRCDPPVDTDNDGIYDGFETSADSDGDGIPNPMDLDSDGDGASDAEEHGEGFGPCEARNSDGDAIPDFLDNDSDNDGLSDREEREVYFTDPLDEDSDDDGYSDAAEIATGHDPRNPDDGIDPEDFFLVLPFGGPEERRTLRFNTSLRKADVFFIMDTTGSMQGEVNNLRSGLSDLVDQLVASIPDVGIGFGGFAGFGGAAAPGGSCSGALDFGCQDGPPGDLPFELVSTITTDRAAMQMGVDNLQADSGGANTASSTEALYQTATGAGIGEWVPPQTCQAIPDENGRRHGYPCFRPGSLPIIIPMTDTASKNGPEGGRMYPVLNGHRPHTFEETRAALLGIGARVIGITSIEEEVAGAAAQMRWYAQQTGTVNGSGSPLHFSVDADGRGLTSAVADQIRLVATETPQDISTRTEDGNDLPAGPVQIDATLMIESIMPTAAFDASGVEIPATALNRDDRNFYGVTPGTSVEFDITFLNDVVQSARTSQIFLAKIVVVGNRVADLDEREVIIIVPAGSGPLI